MGHHQFTNDPDRDPDLLNLGHGKRADEFPMTRRRFITVIYFCLIVAPIRFARYQWAYFKVNTLGKGKNVYMERATRGERTLRVDAPAGDDTRHCLHSRVQRGLEVPDRHGSTAVAGPARIAGNHAGRGRQLCPAETGPGFNLRSGKPIRAGSRASFG